MTDEEMVTLSNQLTDLSKSLLIGQSPEVQGIVLLNLTANWLAGHLIPGDPVRTAEFRQELLDVHLRLMWQMIDTYDRERADG